MRVLHAVHAYPPSVGGSERVVARLSQALLDRGHEVEVATCEHPDRGDAVDGVPVHGFAANPLGWARYRRFVHRGVAEDRWDVVMTYHSKVWSHLALAPFGRVGPRWVYAPTEFTDLRSSHPRHLVYYRTLEPRSLQAAERVMVLTQADAERAVEVAGQRVRDRVRVVPNGVDADWWIDGQAGDVRERLGLPTEAPLALFVGALWPHKEVGTLVDALASTEELHLVVAGPGRGRTKELQERAWSRNVQERVHFLGPVDREDLRALYHASSVHASASNNEGFGLTFLEAMACGLPVVARPVGVVPELVEQGAAVRVAETTPAFARAMEEMAGRGGEGNVSIARSYDWEAVADQLVALYEEVAR